MDLKLRAWHKKNKTMHRVTMILFDTEEIDYEGNLGEPVMWYHFELMAIVERLTDKNACDVYEGDVFEINKTLYVVVKSVNQYLASSNDSEHLPIGAITEHPICGNIFEKDKFKHLKHYR